MTKRMFFAAIMRAAILSSCHEHAGSVLTQAFILWSLFILLPRLFNESLDLVLHLYEKNCIARTKWYVKEMKAVIVSSNVVPRYAPRQVIAPRCYIRALHPIQHHQHPWGWCIESKCFIISRYMDWGLQLSPEQVGDRRIVFWGSAYNNEVAWMLV